MRVNKTFELLVAGVVTIGATQAHAASFTFLTHPALNGVVTSDPYLGNADDQNFSQFGTNSIGAASQFLGSNGVYGFLGGQMTSQGLTAFGPSPQQYFGLNEHTSVNMFGQWNLNSAFIFNRAFTQTLDSESESVINMGRDQTYTSSFVLNDGLSGGRMRISGSGRYLLKGEDAALRYSGDLLTHFQTVQPLLPTSWVAVAQEDQFWEVLDGPQAGVTGFTTATFFVEDSLAVPIDPPQPLPQPWQTSGFSAAYSLFGSDELDWIEIGNPQFGPGTASLESGSTNMPFVIALGAGNVFRKFFNPAAVIVEGDGAGSLTVSGEGTTLAPSSSEFAAAGGIWVGESDSATMKVLAGADVSSGAVVYVGLSYPESNKPRTSRLVVDGAGSTLLIGQSGCANCQSGELHVSSPVEAQVVVSAGGVIDVAGNTPREISPTEILPGAYVTVGGEQLFGLRGGHGTVTVDGAGSALNVHGDDSAILDIANGGEGLLNVLNGGKVRVDGLKGARVAIAAKAAPNDSAGSATITGAGSELDAGDLLSVGAAGDPFSAGGNGTLIVEHGGKVIADRILIGANGTLLGSGGTLQGDVSIDGMLAPGASPGSMLIEGNLTLGGSGRLVIEIAGTEPGNDYDLIEVTGNTELAGTLEIVLLDDFTPSASDTFDFLKSFSFSGEFNEFIVPVFGTGQTFSFAIGANGFTASVTPVPLPAAAPLLGLGIVALSLSVRGRRAACTS